MPAILSYDELFNHFDQIVMNNSGQTISMQEAEDPENYIELQYDDGTFFMEVLKKERVEWHDNGTFLLGEYPARGYKTILVKPE